MAADAMTPSMVLTMNQELRHYLFNSKMYKEGFKQVNLVAAMASTMQDE